MLIKWKGPITWKTLIYKIMQDTGNKGIWNTDIWYKSNFVSEIDNSQELGK